MTHLLLIAQLTVITSAPPLPPDQAVAALQGSRSIADRTNARPAEPPRTVIIRSSPTAGPFGELRSTPLPVSCCSVYVHPRTPQILVRRAR
jgi:hypothetical protein